MMLRMLTVLMMATICNSAYAARAAETDFRTLQAAVGDHWSNVFSIALSLTADGFDTSVRRNGGTADSTLKEKGADQKLVFDTHVLYDGSPAETAENIISDGGATSCWNGKCSPYTDASGLLYNQRLWGTPRGKIKVGMTWNVAIDQAWELGPAGVQTVTVTGVDEMQGTVTLKREGSAVGFFAGEAPHATLVKNGQRTTFDVTPGQAHWSGYTTFRHGIVISDELLVVRNDLLQSQETGTIKAVNRRYMLLNAAPYPTLL
jgi:hypothetical protein